MAGPVKAQTKRQRELNPSAAWMPARRRFTIDEYDRMGEAGILNEDEHAELINGEIVLMAALGSKHTGCVNWLNDAFRAQLGGRVIVSVQNPVRLPPDGEPEPDVMLLRHRPDFYRSAHPLPDDVYLIIEVADTSLPYDRTTKQQLYAAAGIRDFWIVDLANELLLVHRVPQDGCYTEVRRLKRGDTVSPEEFPDLSLTVAEILG